MQESLINDQGYKEIKKFLEQYYGDDLVDSYEKEYGKESVMELARQTAQQGVHFKTPVFDGADFEKDIKPLLKDSELPEVGCL